MIKLTFCIHFKYLWSFVFKLQQNIENQMRRNNSFTGEYPIYRKLVNILTTQK